MRVKSPFEKGGFRGILEDLKINNQHKIMVNAFTNQFNRHAAMGNSPETPAKTTRFSDGTDSSVSGIPFGTSGIFAVQPEKLAVPGRPVSGKKRCKNGTLAILRRDVSYMFWASGTSQGCKVH
jgi:hypothetical protein